MARLWAQTADFDAISVGDTLPVVIKWETEESIRRYADRHGGDADALPRQALIAYITELLGKGFPPERLDAEGGSLDLEQLLPVRADDTISLSGRGGGQGGGGWAAAGALRGGGGKRPGRTRGPRPRRHQLLALTAANYFLFRVLYG